MGRTAQDSLVVKLVATLTKTVAILALLLTFAALARTLTGRPFGAARAPAFVQRGGMWGLLRQEHGWGAHLQWIGG
jgi:hypothetical protein